MKRFLALALTAVAIVTGVSACGSGNCTSMGAVQLDSFAEKGGGGGGGGHAGGGGGHASGGGHAEGGESSGGSHSGESGGSSSGVSSFHPSMNPLLWFYPSSSSSCRKHG